MDLEDITTTVAYVLDGSLGVNLKQAGYQFATLDDLGEIYLKSSEGSIFKLTIEPQAGATSSRHHRSPLSRRTSRETESATCSASSTSMGTAPPATFWIVGTDRSGRSAYAPLRTS